MVYWLHNVHHCHSSEQGKLFLFCFFPMLVNSYLNPIQHLWDVLDQLLARPFQTSVFDLTDALLSELDPIFADKFQNLGDGLKPEKSVHILFAI